MEPNQNTDQISVKSGADIQRGSFVSLFYKTAIVLAFLSLLLSSGYLFYYLSKSPDARDITNPLTMASFNADRRMTLISTAFFVALAFGFLGFALFLINAKGEIEGEGSMGDYKLKITKFSPGLVFIVCSTVIICVCGNFKINYTTDITTGGTGHSTFDKSVQDTKPYSQDDDLPTDSIILKGKQNK